MHFGAGFLAVLRSRGRDPIRKSRTNRRHGGSSCRARRMRRFFIQLRSVFEERPRIFAAPRGPSRIQPDCSRAARIGFRVLDSRLSSRGVDPASGAAFPAPSERDGAGGPALAARAAVAEANTAGSISSVGPFDRMTARSRMVSSSRTFPGQGERLSRSSVALPIDSIGTPTRAANRATRNCMRSGTSHTLAQRRPGEPKRRAVAAGRERQYEARAARGKALRAAFCVLIGSAAGATVGGAVAVGLDRILDALLGTVVGGILGLGAGVRIGCACFSVMGMSGTRRKPSFEATLAGHVPRAVLQVLLVAWSLIGVTVGSTWGGLKGSAWGAGSPWQEGAASWGPRLHPGFGPQGVGVVGRGGPKKRQSTNPSSSRNGCRRPPVSRSPTTRRAVLRGLAPRDRRGLAAQRDGSAWQLCGVLQCARHLVHTAVLSSGRPGGQALCSW